MREPFSDDRVERSINRIGYAILLVSLVLALTACAIGIGAAVHYGWL